MTQSQSELQMSQTELTQLKSYLQQTQGVEGLMSYYRWAIASNPDNIQLYHQALIIKPFAAFDMPSKVKESQIKPLL